MSLAAGLTKFKAHAMDNVNGTVAGTVDGVGDRLLELSPRGDPTLWKRPAPRGYVGGQFESNWFLSVDQRVTTTHKVVDSFQIQGREAMPAQIAGHKVYIQNSLPYAVVLEVGEHSSQVPPGGMLARTGIEGPSIAERAAKRAAG